MQYKAKLGLDGRSWGYYLVKDKYLSYPTLYRQWIELM